MAGFIELRAHDGQHALIPLGRSRQTVGSGDGNDIRIDDDAVSRFHAVLDCFAAGWTLRDVGSRNGTFLNGERISAERAIRPGDEIRIGRAVLVYRHDAASGPPTATAEADAPSLTPRERDVLVALCAPLFSGSVFTRPASIREIAQALVVTEGAVKQHLGRLYDKFTIDGTAAPRPVELANAAINRGAITLAEVQDAAGSRRSGGP